MDGLGLAPRSEDIGAHIVAASLIGLLPCFLIVACITVYSVVSADARLRTQATWALAVTLLLLLSVGEGYLRLEGDWLESLLPAVLNPGATYGLFGITPRSNFILLAFAIFVLRAGGRFQLGYGVLAIAVLFHRQQGALLLGLLVAADLLFRPRSLARPAIVVCVLLVIGYVSAMETFWGQIGISPTLGAPLLVAAGAAFLGFLLLTLRRQKAHTARLLPARLRDDRWLFLAIWLVALGVSLLAQAHSVGGGFFWTLLPARLLIILHPLLILTLVRSVAHVLPSPAAMRADALRRARNLGLLVALVLASIIVFRDTAALWMRTERAARDATWLGHLASLGVSEQVRFGDQRLIYYALVSSLMGGPDHFACLLEGIRHPTLAAALALGDERRFFSLVARDEALDEPRTFLAPADWPSTYVLTTPFVAAVIWRRPDMAEAVRNHLGEPPRGPSSEILCQAIVRGSSSLFLRLTGLADAETLDRPCPASVGLKAHGHREGPPICVLVLAGEFRLINGVLDAGASPEPAGGCDAQGRDVRQIAQTWRESAPYHVRALLERLDGQRSQERRTTDR